MDSQDLNKKVKNTHESSLTPPPLYEQIFDGSQPAKFSEPKNTTIDAPQVLKPKNEPLSVKKLVNVLVHFKGQWSSVLSLSQQIQKTTKEVLVIANLNKDIFSTMCDGPANKLIELCPKLNMCDDFISHKGCLDLKKCKGLHMCHDYLQNSCQQGRDCHNGHNVKTNHNNQIFRKYHLHTVSNIFLLELIRKSCNRSLPLVICSQYNSGNCRNKDQICASLHICHSYVMTAGNCTQHDCSLNHSILTPSCIRLLTKYGISTNESQRDILIQLSAILIKKDDDLLKDNLESLDISLAYEGNNEMHVKKMKKNKLSNVVKKDIKSIVKKSDGNGTNNVSSGGSFKKIPEGDERSSNLCKVTKQKVQKQYISSDSNRNHRTCHSHQLDGNVKMPGICLFSIDGTCVHEFKECKYLHSKTTYHWQVEYEFKWYNLLVYHSNFLEKAFLDVSKNGVTVGALDPQKINSSLKEWYMILGKEPLYADFQTMTLKDTSQPILRCIRRLSTVSSVVLKSSKATDFQWYFSDEKGNWIEFGHIDSLGKENFLCNITSEQIEEQYVKDSNQVIDYENPHFKYQLDFKKMTQKNMTTGKEREVRRRPVKTMIVKQKNTAVLKKDTNKFPTYWATMVPEDTHILVTLTSSSVEYKTVENRMISNLPSAQIMQIKRVQNLHRWNSFQNKLSELSARSCTGKLNIQNLFHGSEPEHVQSICKENFDWRLHGSVAGEPCGKGTYFMSSAAEASRLISPDTAGIRYIFFAKVLIGELTNGDPSLLRPPHNPVTGNLFDTTVDDVKAPTMFVKYDNQEYYPEYIIEFK